MLPLAKRNDIRRRHEAVELLVRQESSAELIAIRQALTELGGLPQLCFKLNQGVGTVFSWEKLYKVGIPAREQRKMMHLTVVWTTFDICGYRLVTLS